MKINDEIIVNVEKITPQGEGLCRYGEDKFVIFIKNCLPNEKIKIKITSLNKHFARGEIIELIEPSKKRIKPFCPMYNACGSCQMQICDYDYLIELKKEILFDIFKNEKNLILPIIKSPKTKEYRHKIQFPARETKNSKRVLLGYFKENTHDITNIKFESSKIKEIGNHSLAGISCQSIEIPEGVEILGVLAISNSSKLKSVKLPKSLITLSGWCFAGNYYLESVIIEENISSLNENLFFGDVNLKQLILKGNISEMANVKNIFSIEAKNITLYGNESVKKFVQKYNENNVEHKIYYAQLEDLYKSS